MGRGGLFVRGRVQGRPAETHGRFLNGFLAGLPCTLEDGLGVREVMAFLRGRGAGLEVGRGHGETEQAIFVSRVS